MCLPQIRLGGRGTGKLAEGTSGLEDVLQPLIEGLSDGHLVCAADGRILAANAAFERLLELPAGWRADTALAAAVVRRCIEATAPAALQDAAGTGLQFMRRVLPDGMFSICVQTAPDPERLPSGRAGGSLLRNVLDSVEASVAVYDEADRFVMGNRRYFELYPHLPDDGSLAGQTFEQMLRRTLASGAPADMQAAIDPEAFIARRLGEWKETGEREQLHPSGRWDLVRHRVTPQGDRVTLRVDITPQKRLQQDLARARDELRAASEAKSRFMASISHELRTPLNAVIGFAEIIGDEYLGPIGTPRYRDYARDIMSAGRHLLDLIGTVLDLSKIESGRVELDESTFELEPLLKHQAEIMGAIARERGNHVRVELDEPHISLTADRRLVAQMVLNLLSNALKFTSNGSVVLRAGRDASGCPTLAVRDTGCGIPARFVSKLGTPFYRVPQELPQPAPGTGLGLALVKEMAALHGAALHVESVEGEGTSVTLTFPRSASERPQRTAD